MHSCVDDPSWYRVDSFVCYSLSNAGGIEPSTNAKAGSRHAGSAWGDCTHRCSRPVQGIGCVWGMEYGVWGMGYEVWGMGYGTRSMEHGAWNMAYDEVCDVVCDIACDVV